jgi:endonuclease G
MIVRNILWLCIATLHLCSCAASVKQNNEKSPIHITSQFCFNGNCPIEASHTNITIENDIFILSANKKTKFADWVAYKVNSKNLRGSFKKRKWRKDPNIDKEYTFIPSDYKGAYASCGYDRGHQCPLGAFTNNSNSYQINYLSNITPQKSTLNRGAWKNLENKVRRLATELPAEDLYIFTGTYYNGESVCKLPTYRVEYNIPNGYWKIILLKNKGSLNYASFVFPQESKNKNHCNYVSNINHIKLLTKTKFPLKAQNPSKFLLEKLGCKNQERKRTY